MSSNRTHNRAFEKAKQTFFEEGKRLDSEGSSAADCWICHKRIDYSVPPGTTDASHELDHYYPARGRVGLPTSVCKSALPYPTGVRSDTQRRVNDRTGRAERIKHRLDAIIALADMQHGADTTATGQTDGRERLKPAMLRGHGPQMTVGGERRPKPGLAREMPDLVVLGTHRRHVPADDQNRARRILVEHHGQTLADAVIVVHDASPFV